MTYKRLVSDGAAAGMPEELVAKVGGILADGLAALEFANAAGVRVAFGSDLLGAMQPAQLEEFELRATVEPAWQTLRAATVHAAALLQQQPDYTGEVAVGCAADLIVVESVERLHENSGGGGGGGCNLAAVIRDGVVVVDRLRGGGSNDGAGYDPSTEAEPARM